MSDHASSTYTHGHHESVLRSHRTRTAANSAAHLLPHLSPGMRLLDIGCGPGTITVDLAARVSPGRVTALEITEDAFIHEPEGVPRALARWRTSSSRLRRKLRAPNGPLNAS